MFTKPLIAAALLPICWGALSWLTIALSYQPLGISGASWYSLRFVIGWLIVYFLFRNSLRQSLSSTVYFFQTALPVPPYTLFVALMFVSMALYWWTAVTFFSLMAISIIEEFFSRIVFIKYPHLTPNKFLLLALISSASFALMHWFYQFDFCYGFTACEGINKFADHSAFGFLLAMIAYKTKRIELPIIVHIVSNINGAIMQAFPAFFALNLAILLAFYTLILGACHAPSSLKPSHK